jgi:hypothetical protein
MYDNMRRLHPRGAASRGICIDAEGAVLGPDCVLVRRTPRGFRSIERDEASSPQKCLLDGDRDHDWLFRQCQRIADELDRGELALAQIFGLHIPIGTLDDRQLARIARIGLAKAGFNPTSRESPKAIRRAANGRMAARAMLPWTVWQFRRSRTLAAAFTMLYSTRGWITFRRMELPL